MWSRMLSIRTMFRRYVVVAALLFAGLAIASQAAGRDLSGKVVGVHDGDTLTVLDGTRQHKVRIAGIDAPEKAQAFGAVAKDTLARLTFGKRVDLHCPKRDRYGRDVCSVQVGLRDVGLEQVRAGGAWWYREYAREQVPEARREYEAAENEAREARRGLWADPQPTPPWAWRRGSRG